MRIFSLIFALFLSGCFSLKTPLPAVSYFDLDENFAPKTCKKSVNLGISSFNSVALYDTPAMILRKENGEIISLQTQVWVDLPKNLFKKILLKKFNAECIHTSIAPFGGVKNDLLLKIEILNFDILESGGVEVAIFYELSSLKSFEVLKSGILSAKERGEAVPAFKKAILHILDKLSKEIDTSSSKEDKTLRK